METVPPWYSGTNSIPGDARRGYIKWAPHRIVLRVWAILSNEPYYWNEVWCPSRRVGTDLVRVRPRPPTTLQLNRTVRARLLCDERLIGAFTADYFRPEHQCDYALTLLVSIPNLRFTWAFKFRWKGYAHRRCTCAQITNKPRLELGSFKFGWTSLLWCFQYPFVNGGTT